MGCVNSKTADELTVDLWNLINKKASEYGSPSKAEHMILGGANVCQQQNGRYMIEEVREQAKRNRDANRASHEENCQRIVKLLADRASSLLIEAVKQGKLSDIQLLSSKLGGDLHQSEGFGPLGLVGLALKSTTCNQKLIQYLVENHSSNRSAIGRAVTDMNPPQPLHRMTQDPSVVSYLSQMLNLMLLELPVSIPVNSPQDSPESLRLVAHAEALITNGANSTLTDANGNNVLCQSVIQNRVPLVRRLLHLGVDSTYTNGKTGLNILQLAESQSQRDPVLIALLKNHSFNLQFQSSITKLGESSSGHLDYEHWFNEFQSLLTTGADIHCLNNTQDTPLHLLVLALSKLSSPPSSTTTSSSTSPSSALPLNVEEDARFIRMFLSDFHADPERTNSQGLRPLEYAIRYDSNLRILSELLDASAPCNSKTKQSVLHFAQQQADSKHKQSAINLTQDWLNRALWRVCITCNKRGKGHENINNKIKYLLELGADINAPTGDEEENRKMTPLCLIAKQGDVYLVKQLISIYHANATEPAQDEEKSYYNTPLHYASESGQLSIVQYLRSLQIDMNVLNSRKESALHLAARNGHVRVCKYLALWGTDTTLRDVEGATPLDAAKQSANEAVSKTVSSSSSSSSSTSRSPTSPASGKSSSKEYQQHQLVISFLTRCEPTEICCEASNEIQPIRADLLDVCAPIRLLVPPELVPSPSSDEDPLGEKSLGFGSGSPNGNMKSAAKKGNLTDVKKAVSQGADVRHLWDGKCAYRLAVIQSAEYTKDKNNATQYESSAEYGRKAAACDRVAEYLVEVATTKVREAVEQGNEGRVIGYHSVGASLQGLVKVAAAANKQSVGIMHYLLTKLDSNYQLLWSYFDGPASSHSPYALAKSRGYIDLALYIQAQLSLEVSRGVSNNNLAHVRECCEAGGLPDTDGVENLNVALQHKNIDLVQYLLDRGARISGQRYSNVAAIAQDDSISGEMKLLLRQRMLDRLLRLASASGNLISAMTNHHLGGDLCSMNVHGATPLSLSLQFTHHPALVHYLVTRGCTMLHKEEGVSTVIPLSRSLGHPNVSKLEEFLKDSLNVALFSSIVEGDLVVSGALAALGGDVSTARDEYGNTLTHVAVTFQGHECVSWLTERGVPLNVANQAGEYAITAATLKGDAASVEYIVKTNAGTKSLKNSSGKSALDLAKDLRLNKLVQLMDPGNKEFPFTAGSSENEADNSNEPTQEYDELIRAASYGQLDVVKIFIEEKYASLDRKTNIAKDMIKAAESRAQSEILRLLLPHYKSLTSEVASDQTNDRIVTASAEQKQILAGFLTGLSGLIAGGEVNLDPSDPGTYQQLFANLTTKIDTQTEFLKNNLNNPQELTKAASTESNQLAQKMEKIESEMRAMEESKLSLAKRLQIQEAQLSACRTAIEKRDCYSEIQEVKDQLSTLQSSVSLFTRANETAMKKKKTIDSLKSQPNLLITYSTIENRLQGLFLACKSATSGMMSLNMTQQGETRSKIVNITSGLAELIPVIGTALSKVISIGVGTLVTHMDKSRQKQEISNITTLGNIEELEKAASNAAALVVFYYSAQINSILVDSTKATKSSSSADNNLTQLGEYLVLFMIAALRDGTIVPGMDLGQQLWYSVVSQDVLQSQTLLDQLIGTPGDLKVQIKENNEMKVTLRALIGSVGIMDHNNRLFIPKPKILQECQKLRKDFAPFYSISYLSAFTSESEIRAIIHRRNLQICEGNEASVFLSSSVKVSTEETAILKASIALFQQQQQQSAEGSPIDSASVVPYVDSESSRSEGSNSQLVVPSSAPSIAGNFNLNRMSLQVYDRLSSQGLILTQDQAKDLVQQMQTENNIGMTILIDTLREDSNTKSAHYQSSIDAATETIMIEKEKMQADNRMIQQELQKNYMKQLNEQNQAFTKQLQDQNAQHEMKLRETIVKYETQLKEFQLVTETTLKELQADAAMKLIAQADAQKAALNALVSTSTDAQTSANLSKEASEKASLNVTAILEKSTIANEKWTADLAASKLAFDSAMKVVSESSAKTIADYKSSLDVNKQAAKDSSIAAKESAIAAVDTAKQMKELREMTAKDMTQQKEIREKEHKQLLAQAKEAENNANKAADESKKAAATAKKAQSEAEDCKITVAKLEAKLNK